MTPPPHLPAPGPPRSPWQRLYGAAHAWRRRRAARTARHLPRPVVSLGNLHWGGTGKTPLVAAIAGHLERSGRRVVILSRGYRGAARSPLLVSRGDGPRVGPEVAGDEPVALALALPGVAVVVGRDRHAAGLLALADLRPAPELFLLDDGFSHVRLARDLDLLALPDVDPWGGGRLPPGGRLREPLASARHAHALLLTGTTASPASAGEVAHALAVFGFAGRGFAAPTRFGVPRLVADGQPLPPATRLFLVAAIARPERLRAAAAGMGLQEVGSLVFPDHHPYPPRSLRAIERDFAAAGAEAVLTTAKDQVKLAGRLALPLAVLPVAAEPEPPFWTWLDAALDGLTEPAA